jgi:hypothetical protein
MVRSCGCGRPRPRARGNFYQERTQTSYQGNGFVSGHSFNSGHCFVSGHRFSDVKDGLNIRPFRGWLATCYPITVVCSGRIL